MEKRKLFWMVWFLFVVGYLKTWSDGFVVVPHPHPGPQVEYGMFPLEVKYHRVRVEIEDQIARTRIDQVFVNPTGRRMEGFYLFPMPKDAVIKKFSMWINGHETEAEVLDARKARMWYEDIVRRMKDPALLEYHGNGLFKARIYPIEPREEKRVVIEYDEILRKDNQIVEYLYPLNTEKFSSKPLKDVSIQINLTSGENIKNVYCPTHAIDVVRKDQHKVMVSYEEGNVKPDRDFKLYYSTDNSKLGFTILSFRDSVDQPGYFLMNISPGFGKKNQKIIPKDIIFVLDVSGSMDGIKIKQAKKALLHCLDRLNQRDTFDIIRFSTEAESLFGRLSIVNKASLGKAERYVKKLNPVGGTNIDHALSLAMKYQQRESRPFMIVFITDGKPTIGEIDEEKLLQKIRSRNVSNMRIFTFGIGNEVNTHLLDKITELTKAYRTYMSEEEDLTRKITNFYEKVQSPVLTNVLLDFGKNVAVFKLHPGHLPDIFKGSSITLLGRYRGSGDANIVLSGKIDNRKVIYELQSKAAFSSVQGEKRYDFIPALWAARRVGYLLDQVRLHGQSREILTEITELARAHGILTPYTSFLIVEEEKDKVQRNLIPSKDQTLAQISSQDSAFENKNRREFAGIHEKSGKPGVRLSQEVQRLNDAADYSQTRQGKSRLDYSDVQGKKKNLLQQVKYIQGRAIYNTGSQWLDSNIQNYRYKKTVKIQFGSSEYFGLLNSEPAIGEFLALGRNVRFVFDKVQYDIFE